jgi:hypothetical protein
MKLSPKAFISTELMRNVTNRLYPVLAPNLKKMLPRFGRTDVLNMLKDKFKVSPL